jgi:hypothetical protein
VQQHGTENYWFVRKSYGWGWTPASREGWFVVLAHIALVITLARVILYDQIESPGRVLLFVGCVLVSTLLLIIIAWKTGEPPAWQWGKK